MSLDGQRHRSKAGKAEGMGCTGRQIDHPTPDERATINDAHDNRAAVMLVGDLHPGAERQRAVRRNHRRPLHADAAGGLAVRKINGRYPRHQRTKRSMRRKRCAGIVAVVMADVVVAGMVVAGVVVAGVVVVIMVAVMPVPCCRVRCRSRQTHCHPHEHRNCDPTLHHYKISIRCPRAR